MPLSCLHAINPQQGLMLSLLLAGLAGGFTHCVAMCGPFVLAQTGSAADNVSSDASDRPSDFNFKKLVGRALFPYHFGRMTTYVVMAVLLNTLFNVAFLSLPIKSIIIAPVLFLTGVIFMANAFPKISALAPWATKIRMPMPLNSLNKIIAPLLSSSTTFKRYLLGVVLGFMPCGLVMAALIASSMADTAMQAGAAMALFAAGTIPALAILATGGNFLRTKYPKSFSNLQGGMMLVSGIWLCVLASLMIF